MKKYLETIEDIVALKDTNTIIYQEMPKEYKNKEKTNYFKFINGVPCWFDEEKKAMTYNVPFYLENKEKRYYTDVYGVEDDAKKEDIGKLCLFWDYGTDKEADPNEIHVLYDIKKNKKGKKEYWCDGCGDCGYYHARRCTKEEVERITGLKVGCKMSNCKDCGREEWGFLSALDDDGYCYSCAAKHNKEKIARLQEQLDIVTEQRNDIHIDKQVLQKQLNEANRIIKKLYKESGNPIGIDYLEKWGVK